MKVPDPSGWPFLADIKILSCDLLGLTLELFRATSTRRCRGSCRLLSGDEETDGEVVLLMQSPPPEANFIETIWHRTQGDRMRTMKGTRRKRREGRKSRRDKEGEEEEEDRGGG